MKSKKSKFVKASVALKDGKSKAEYVLECKQAGYNAVYSGKDVVREDDSVARRKGFYLTPILEPNSLRSTAK